MDQVIFSRDTVLSDVHLLLPNACHLMTRLNAVGQPVFTSKFKILWVPGKDEEVRTTPERTEAASSPGAADLPLDDDGDLDVVRRPRDGSPDRERMYPVILQQASHNPTDGCSGKKHRDEEEEGGVEDDDEEEASPTDVIRIEHTMATPLEDVGKQIWRGAFLLADFIMSRSTEFQEDTVLELGAGTGLTSIVMATQAKTVYCTDVGQDLLNMCQRNVTLNQHLNKLKESDIRVRQLDWTGHEFCTDSEEDFAWTEEEVTDVHNKVSVILAADVCYDDELTDALFRTIYRITSNLQNPCVVYLSIEKRFNFTLRHMNTSCEAYDHFRHCLEELCNMEDGRMHYSVEQVSTTFPQFLQYERVEQLEIWKMSAKQT